MAKMLLTDKGKAKIPQNEWESVVNEIENTIHNDGGLDEDEVFVGHRGKDTAFYLTYGEDFISG